ncbi:MAG: hypothetical protein MZU79_07100 [Anaerotruncus sp.]|nr:hypothetical protein [Anaerotruncus sp.]
MEPIPSSRSPRIAGSMRGRRFFDFRNLYEPSELTKLGFIYEGFGRTRPGSPEHHPKPYPGEGERTIAGSRGEE